MNILKKVDIYQVELNKHRPFEGDLLHEIQDYYRVGLTYTSNALEGNTLTESETKVLLEDGLTAGGKPLIYAFEADGHAKAYDYMFSLLKNDTITEQDILTLHSFFYRSIDETKAGIYRTSNVIITGSHYSVPPHEKVQQEMDSLILWIKNERDNYHPVAFAAQLHKRFVFIHPFIDGNGRIARLLMNTALIQKGYMLAIVPPVLRTEYIALLERAHKNDKDFVSFIADRVFETQKDMLRLLNLPFPKLEKKMER